MTKKLYVIYKHTNKITQKVYIGQTCQKLEKRWCNYGQCYLHHKKFYEAIKKYGWDNFEHKVLESGLSKEQAKWREDYYIELYDAIEEGYNTRYSTSKGHVGRPTVDRSMKFNRAFETTTALDDRLKEVAKKRGITLSALIRDILEQFFEERKF